MANTLAGLPELSQLHILQRLKMEALILAPAESEVRYVIKFLNAQSLAPIEIHRSLIYSR